MVAKTNLQICTFWVMDVLLQAITLLSGSPVSSVQRNGNLSKIHLEFASGLKCNISINKKSCGNQKSLYLYIPATLTWSGKSCKYVSFRNQYGVGNEFRSFLTKQVKRVLITWNSCELIKYWCEHLKDWKKQVEAIWEESLPSLKTKKDQDLQKM